MLCHYQKFRNHWIRFLSSYAKSEREKMISGEIFCKDDPELVSIRRNTAKLLKKYNDSEPDDKSIRKEMLKTIFTKNKEIDFYVCPPFIVDYGVNTKFGNGAYIAPNSTIFDSGPITIGENTLIGPGCYIVTAAHPLTVKKRVPGDKLFAKAINIGKNVWLGAGVTVCPGVTIGDNTVIGANSTVTKDIPPNVVAAGSPARVIKKINQDEDC